MSHILAINSVFHNCNKTVFVINYREKYNIKYNI